MSEIKNILDFITNESEYIEAFIAHADKGDQLRYFKFYAELIQLNIKLIELKQQEDSLDLK